MALKIYAQKATRPLLELATVSCLEVAKDQAKFIYDMYKKMASADLALGVVSFIVCSASHTVEQISEVNYTPAYRCGSV